MNSKEMPVEDNPGRLITIEELAVFATLSVRMLYRLMKDENFPKLKIGKRGMLYRRAVRVYLAHKQW
jgi:predicted DNA-binding transcriptional regulator AlpA